MAPHQDRAPLEALSLEDVEDGRGILRAYPRASVECPVVVGVLVVAVGPDRVLGEVQDPVLVRRDDVLPPV
jgi:hypothetical protein